MTRRTTTILGYCPRPACEKPIRAVVETQRNGHVDDAVILDHACTGRPYSGPPSNPRPGACPTCETPTVHDAGFTDPDPKAGTAQNRAPSTYCPSCGWSA